MASSEHGAKERSSIVRVLFVSQAPGVGGGERLVLPVLARSPGLHVTVLAPSPVCGFATELGLPSVAFELPRAHRLRHALRVLRGAVRVARTARRVGAHVVYANGTRAAPYALTSRLLGGPPVLVHHHGVLTTGPTRSFARVVDQWADLVVVPSRTSAAPFRTDRVRVIPNGVDLERFRPGAEDVRQTFGLPPDVPVVATLTRPDPRKGMEAFLDLAERLRSADAAFLLAGAPAFPHEREPYERVRARARAMGGRVVLAPDVDDPVRVFASADVFVHLGEAEGFGLTVVEAMACGVPVVAYDWGGVAETVEQERTGLLVPPGDLGAAASAVGRLLSDPELRTRLGERARAVCERCFGSERFDRELTAAVRTAAGR